ERWAYRSVIASVLCQSNSWTVRSQRQPSPSGLRTCGGDRASGSPQSARRICQPAALPVKTTGNPPRESEQTHFVVFVTSTVTGRSLSGCSGSHRAFPFFLTFGQCAPYEGVQPRILGRAVSPANPLGMPLQPGGTMRLGMTGRSDLRRITLAGTL